MPMQTKPVRVDGGVILQIGKDREEVVGTPFHAAQEPVSRPLGGPPGGRDTVAVHVQVKREERHSPRRDVRECKGIDVPLRMPAPMHIKERGTRTVPCAAPHKSRDFTGDGEMLGFAGACWGHISRVPPSFPSTRRVSP